MSFVCSVAMHKCSLESAVYHIVQLPESEYVNTCQDKCHDTICILGYILGSGQCLGISFCVITIESSSDVYIYNPIADTLDRNQEHMYAGNLYTSGRYVYTSY
jgi:hypothetical protein